MAKIAQSLTELVGNTPILELKNYEEAKHLPAHLLAKLEYFNPLGSVKDRVAEAMIEQGIKDGLINDKTVIIEPTSGNTGIGLAFVCVAKKLHLILTMPDTMSVERRKIVKALGAEVVEMHLFRNSLKIRSIQKSMSLLPQRKSGGIRMAG